MLRESLVARICPASIHPLLLLECLLYQSSLLLEAHPVRECFSMTLGEVYALSTPEVDEEHVPQSPNHPCFHTWQRFVRAFALHIVTTRKQPGQKTGPSHCDRCEYGAAKIRDRSAYSLSGRRRRSKPDRDPWQRNGHQLWGGSSPPDSCDLRDTIALLA